MEQEELKRLFLTGTKAKRVEFLQSLPDFFQRDVAVKLAGSDDPGAAQLALSAAGVGLAPFHPARALPIALAAVDALTEITPRVEPGVIQPFTLSNTAHSAITSALAVGDAKQALALAQRFESRFADEPQNIDSIRVSKIEAMVELQMVEQAAEAISAVEPSIANPTAKAELNRLKRLVDQMIGTPAGMQSTGPADKPSPEIASFFEAMEALKRQIMTMASDPAKLMSTPGLMAKLTNVQTKMAEAQAIADEGDYVGATRIVESVLDDLGLTGEAGA